MNLHSRKVIIFLASLVFLLIPVIVAYAADYVLLEPSLVDKNPGATSPGLTTYLGWLYNSFFALIAIASFVLIVWGGFEYVTSSIPGLKANGLARINQALLGFGIALFAWLILETISAGTFTNINLNLDNVGGTSYSAGPAGTGGGTRGPAGPTTPATNNPTPPTVGTNGPSNLKEQEVRDKLKAAGITPSSTGGEEKVCADNQSEGCSTYAGLQQTTVDGVISIKKDCDSLQINGEKCSFVLVGGTEHGKLSPTNPYTHPAGYKVDIDRPNNNTQTNVDKYFTSGDFKFIGNRSSDNAPQYSNGNVTAANEGDHWDVTFKPGVSGGTH